MEVRIMKSDGSLGKKVYEGEVPGSMYPLRRKLNKTLIGIGKWRNNGKPYIVILPINKNLTFLEESTLKEIKEWQNQKKIKR